MHDCSGLQEAIIKGDSQSAASEARKLLVAGMKPVDLMTEGVGPSMAVVGRLFENGECFVPELLMAARATKVIFEIIRPLLSQTDARPKARVVLGTVRGDLHDIGKNLVAMMMEGAGFEIIDLGVDVTAEKFINAVKERNATIIGMSALLTTTMVNMKEVIQSIETNGLRKNVKIIVGGAPLTQNFADEIGADGYAPDAASAVELVKKLLN
jgi:5-methyltetrahydrofolate--homocysteine methyltransferase